MSEPAIYQAKWFQKAVGSTGDWVPMARSLTMDEAARLKIAFKANDWFALPRILGINAQECWFTHLTLTRPGKVTPLPQRREGG